METGRVEAFSDGVFAIAITLLILAVGIEEAISQGHLSDELLNLWPAYIAYAISFLTVGIMWVNHHQIFRHFEHVDRTLLLLNILLLMLIAFTPFPTRVVAQHMESGVDRQPAALLYGITMTLTAIQNRDYFLLQGIFIFIIIGVLIANFLVDLSYLVIDPRTRHGMEGTGR